MTRKQMRRRVEKSRASSRQWILPVAIVAVLAIAGIVFVLRSQQSSGGNLVADSTWTEPAQSACANVPAPETKPARTTKQWTAPDTVIDTTHTYCAILTTNKGRIVAELYPPVAPKNVNNFVFLAQQGFYDNITWHRVITGFVAQSGDPTGSGAGGPGYDNMPLEVNPRIKYDRPGRVGVARTNDPNSAGSQFFITYAPQPGLDPNSQSQGYTIIGQVVEGMEVVRQITPFEADKNPGGRGDPLVSVRVVDLGRR
jgi:peptidylprolyl isomerase